MGAKIFEKHVALQNQKRGLDIKFSIKGNEIKTFVKNINDAWQITKKNNYIVNESQNLMKKYRRSIFAIKNIIQGQRFTKNNIRIIRPGYGVAPIYYEKLLGKKAPYNLFKGNPIKKNIINKLKIHDEN